MGEGDFLEGREAYINVPTDENLAEAFETGLIVLDTNILLDLYRAEGPARKIIFSLIEGVSKRLFIPSMVATEFLSRRVDCIGDVFSRRTKLQRNIKSSAAGIRNTVERSGVTPDRAKVILGDFESAIEELNQDLPTFDIKYDLGGRDEILTELIRITKGRVAPVPDSGQLNIDIAEGQRRFDTAQPPGVGDAHKPINGDYLVWAEVLRHAADSQSILFVTNDLKTEGDWFDENYKREPKRPHPRLWHEAKTHTGADLYMTTGTGFEQLGQSMIGEDDAAVLSQDRARRSTVHAGLTRVLQELADEEARMVRDAVGDIPGVQELADEQARIVRDAVGRLKHDESGEE